MNRKYKQLWIAALRGGKYEQGRGCLRNIYNKCCPLGVLADIVDPQGWERSEQKQWRHLRCANFPAREVRRKSGLQITDAEKIIQLSDYSKFSFHAIANYIAQHC